MRAVLFSISRRRDTDNPIKVFSKAGLGWKIEAISYLLDADI